MSNNLLLIISTFIFSVILIIITMVIIKKKQSNKYKKEVEKLDVEKNMLIGVPILSEISKVKELVKTDNLKEKLNDWDTTFKLIKDDKIPKLTDMISEVDFLVDRKEYRQAVKKIAYIEMEIDSLKHKTNNLLEEVKLITNSEERNRALITKLKIIYRELQNKFERTKKDYGEIAAYLDAEFDLIDSKFADFEKAMDYNDYVNVEKIVEVLNDKINYMQKLLDGVPSIVLLATILIPNRLNEVMLAYSRMRRDGYPLDYLNIEYNAQEIKNKISNVIANLKKLDMGDSEIELKTMLDYCNSIFNEFDKEKECKDVFRENIKAFKFKLDKVNRVVRDIYLQIDDIKYNYNLSNEEINKFSLLNKNLEKINQDYKILDQEGKGKTFAYSKLVDELDGLTTKLSRLQDDLDFQLKSITSMKDDETRAREELENIQTLLKKSKQHLKEHKIPVIPNSYFIELSEAQEAIREIVKELDKKPIVIKILNIRVDTARDLVFKIYNKTNNMIKSVTLSEKAIVYGNRYRSSYVEIDKALDKATNLFNKGQYKQSLELTKMALESIGEDILEKIN